MSNRDHPTQEPDATHVYYIRIKERLHKQWEKWFEGMEITQTTSGETVIAGQIIDQAQLFGLLKKIRNLGLTLVSVTHIYPDDQT